MHRRASAPEYRPGVALTAAALLLGLAGAAAPAVAAPAQAEVVLVLRPAATLDTERAPVDARERADRVRRTTPSAGSQRAVHRWLAQHGFTVRAATPWAVVARGPVQQLDRGLPAALRPRVLSAVPVTDRPFRARAIPVGYAPVPLREAYALRGAAADGRGTTVATIQFSGWREADAAVFASAAGIDLAPGQITTEALAGAVADRPDGAGGDFEVSLDVQAVLGAAPAARQRVFVGPNTTSGAIAVYDAVATAAERDGLAAVSISWGACELQTSPALLRALEVSLARMVAAGTTVTAASGDVGAYGCATPDRPDGRLSVDYPASSPSVLGVGGTTLRRLEGGWAETAWSDQVGAGPGFAGFGTGGGLSARFERPLWQQGRVQDAGRRAVPDVAAVADPGTGVGVYGPDLRGGRAWQATGGTSLGAPLVAGQIASTLSALGRTAGLGSLHVPLYAAPAGFRDVVHGGNHRYAAGPGYDMTTGLGAPQWDALGPQLLVPQVLAPAATSALDVAVAAYSPGSAGDRYGLAESAEAACAAAAGPLLPTGLRLAPGPDRATAVVLAVHADGACRTTARPLLLDRTGPAVSATLGRTSRPGVLALGWRAEDPAPASGVGVVSWVLRRTDTGQVTAQGTSGRSGSVLRTVPRGVPHRLEVTARDALDNGGGAAVSDELRG